MSSTFAIDDRVGIMNRLRATEALWTVDPQSRMRTIPDYKKIDSELDYLDLSNPSTEKPIHKLRLEEIPVLVSDNFWAFFKEAMTGSWTVDIWYKDNRLFSLGILLLFAWTVYTLIFFRSSLPRLGLTRQSTKA